MTSIIPELQSLAPSAIIELFELHTNLELHNSSEIYRFHSGTNMRQANGDIIWNGNRYQIFPIEASGFEYNGSQLPRPTLRVANLFSVITSVLLNVNQTNPGNDLIGAKIIRIRTCARYLDAVNFEGNQNPFGSPDPTAEAPREIYSVDRKKAENRDYVEFELAAAIDLVNILLPGRQCISSVCQWVYRGPECGYTGSSAFDENDNAANLIAATNFAAGTSSISAGTTLGSNQFLVSPNGWYKAIMQTDGNFVVFNKAIKAVWSTLTYGKGLSTFAYQLDGNLVVYDAFNRPTWNSNTQNQATIQALEFTKNIPDSYPTGDKDAFVWIPAPNLTAGTSSVSSAGSGFFLYPGEKLVSSNLWYQLLMQRDGNLVVYNKSNTSVWSTQTGGQASYAFFQPDGNFVLYRYSDGAAIWSSQTGLGATSTAPASNLATGTGVLYAGSTASSRLSAGQDLFTTNGWYKLSMGGDGNLSIINKGNKIVWQTNTIGSGATYAQFQTDGNFVLYDNSGGVKWQSNYGAYPVNAGKRLVLQPDGNLVLYGTGGATSTSTVPAPNFQTGTGKIFVGATASSKLYRGQSLYSANGWYRLTMQTDGNLVITNKANMVTWNSGTYGTAAYVAAFQPDGNLVLYASDESTPIWYTNHGTYGQYVGYYWLLDNSGELVLLDGNNSPIWRNWTGTTVEPTVTVTSQTAETVLWSSVSGSSAEPGLPAYPTSILTIGGNGNLNISTGGSIRWTNGYDNPSQPGIKQETGDNRAHALFWQIFGSADAQAGQTKEVAKSFTFGSRSLTVNFTATATLNLPAGHYSNQTKSWVLTSESYVSSTGRWYLDEFVDAFATLSTANPFKNHPNGTMVSVGRQYRIEGILSSNGRLDLQNDGNFVLYDSANNPIWNSAYYTALEPKVPGPGNDAKDVCGKRLSSCRARFGDNADLPFGSFPGVGQYFA
jgi:lambda family phage minor tail protein L